MAEGESWPCVVYSLLTGTVYSTDLYRAISVHYMDSCDTHRVPALAHCCYDTCCQATTQQDKVPFQHPVHTVYTTTVYIHQCVPDCCVAWGMLDTIPGLDDHW